MKLEEDEALVEKVARALAKQEWNPRKAPFKADRKHWMESARAALRAAIPEMVEMAATEAAAACLCARCVKNVPAAIRSLAGAGAKP